MDVQGLLSRVREGYASAKSYRDAGEVTQVAKAATLSEVTSGRFTTEFVRATGHLVFQFVRGDGDSFVVRAEGGVLVQARPPKPAGAPIAAGIAGLAGITLRSAHTIPRLLLPGIGGRSVCDAPAARLVGWEYVGGERCAVVDLEGDWSGSRLFIGDTTMLVRRLSAVARANEAALKSIGSLGLSVPIDARAESQTNYEPAIDAN